MNKVVLVGRLTKDAELKYTPSGVAVATFIMAVDRDYKDAQGQNQADFISCVAWRTQAEFLGNYIKKGYMVAVSGSIQVRSYQDQQGQTRIITEVIVDQVKNLTPRQDNKQSAPDPNVRTNGQPTSFPVDEGLPF